MAVVSMAVLAGHPFLRGLGAAHVETLGTAATEVPFAPGQRIFDAGAHAGRFWLIEAGHVALDLRVPGEGTVTVETAGIGDLLGWSWLFPPFSWT
jgi:CRP-like cAMP-binding protein